MVKENWYALTVSIFRNCPPEMAFELLDNPHPDSVPHLITPEDVADMKAMKFGQGLSYQEIGDIYGVNKHTVFYHVKRGPEWAGKQWAAARARKGVG